MSDITLQLTVEETNLILDALGQKPFVEVYNLISKVQTQASQQLQAEDQSMPEAPIASAQRVLNSDTTISERAT